MQTHCSRMPILLRAVSPTMRINSPDYTPFNFEVKSCEHTGWWPMLTFNRRRSNPGQGGSWVWNRLSKCSCTLQHPLRRSEATYCEMLPHWQDLSDRVPWDKLLFDSIRDLVLHWSPTLFHRLQWEATTKVQELDKRKHPRQTRR